MKTKLQNLFIALALLALATISSPLSTAFAQAPAGMVVIPAGSFTMGDSLDGLTLTSGGLPLHTVYVSPFWMDQYDVTLALWQQVYNWAITHGYSFANPGSGKAANYPVETVDWFDCLKWCNARSEMEGRTPAYYTSAAQTTVYRTGEFDSTGGGAADNTWVNWNAGYRLPTEAEWEKAAGGGVSGQRFPWGNTINESQANYYSCEGCYAFDVSTDSGYNPVFTNGVLPYTSPVGYFAPNGYGLYDMAGNVAQWCWDLSAPYSSASQTDPRGPMTSISGAHEVRGGSWDNSGPACKTAWHALNSGPNYFGTTVGFRSVLPPVPLPPIGLPTESAGGTPVRSNNPWVFTAHFTNIVSDLRLHMQSTTTTNNQGSWANLPGNPYMTDEFGNWTLSATDVQTGVQLADVPTGTQYFRVVASASGYADSASAAVGPETVLDGIAPLGDLNWETTGPARNGALWTFTITEPSLIPNLQLQVQYSSDNLTRWGDLPDGGAMVNQDGTWTLATTNLPVGPQWFRVVASVFHYPPPPTYFDRISASWGPFNIQAALTPVTITTSGAGVHVLDLNAAPEMQDPAKMVFAIAVDNAALQFILTGNLEQESAAITLAAEQYASAELIVGKNQTLTGPAFNLAPGASGVFKGTVNSDVAQIPAPLLGQDGSSLTGNGGSTVTFDPVSRDGIVAQGGGNAIGNGGTHLIGQDGSGIVASGAGNVVGVNGSAVVNRNAQGFTPSDSPFQPKPNLPLPTQPMFTGLMTINGDYNQFAGTLIIGIAGTNTLSDGAQQFDQLVVSGTAYLAGGTIAFGLFDPDDQTNLANVFQPPDGATFDVVVASNIVVGTVHILGPVWGDGLFFKGGVVTLTNGLQAVRLMATHIPPRIFLQNAGPGLHMVYGTNYTGYTVESSPDLVNWSTFSTGTNVVPLSPTNASRFFRLSKP